MGILDKVKDKLRGKKEEPKKDFVDDKVDEIKEMYSKQTDTEIMDALSVLEEDDEDADFANLVDTSAQPEWTRSEAKDTSMFEEDTTVDEATAQLQAATEVARSKMITMEGLSEEEIQARIQKDAEVGREVEVKPEPVEEPEVPVTEEDDDDDDEEIEKAAQA